jgi:hypothetical protein
MSRESIIKMLNGKIRNDEKYNTSDRDGDTASWGYEMGVLITRNEAKQIVDLLSSTAPTGDKSDEG